MLEDQAVKKTLISGFSIQIQPLCPYYLDFLDMVYPFKEFPKRQIRLAAGDVYEIPFEPGKDALYDAQHADYELYIKYKAVEAYNADLLKIRERAREDYLLATCITVTSGPYTIDDPDWRLRMEAAFDERGWRVPKHAGALQLIFIKSIIRSPQERSYIVQAALYKEVSELELSHALDMFQS